MMELVAMWQIEWRPRRRSGTIPYSRGRARPVRIGASRYFPGGVADLTYRFTMDGDRITELVIAA